MTVSGNTVLGSVGGAQTLIVYASANLNAGLTASSATVTGALTVQGNTVLGSLGGPQTLTVYASPTFTNGLTASSSTVTGALTVRGNTALGLTSAQTVTVNAASTFQAPVTANADVTINAALTASSATVNTGLTVRGNTALGSTSAQTVTVNAVSTFQAPVTANSDVTITAAGTLTASGNAVLGSLGASRTLTVSAATTLFNSREAGASVTVAGTNSFAANNDAVIGTTRGNTLTVNSDATFNGAVTGVVGVQVRAVPVTPAASPGATIPNTVSFVDATGNGGSTNVLRLPVPIMGLSIKVQAGSTAFRLMPYNTSYLINADTTSHTVCPNQLVECVAASGPTFYCSVTGPVYVASLVNLVRVPCTTLTSQIQFGQNFAD